MSDPVTPTTPTSPLSDEELVPGLRAGDEATLQVLIDRYWARAYRVALHLSGGDPGAAEDVAQATFVEVLRAVERFEDGRRLRPWFFRLLSNTASDRRRSGGRRRRHEAVGAARADLRVVDAGADAARSEAARLVHAGLDGLEPPLRAALSLRYLEGLSLAEVADALEIPEGTVSSRVRRGLEALRGQLSPSLASLGVAATVVAIEEALRGPSGPVPGAPAAAEVAAARALPAVAPPPPAPAAAQVARARRLGRAVAALGAGALGLALVAALLTEPAPPPASTATPPPASPTAGRTPAVTGGGVAVGPPGAPNTPPAGAGGAPLPAPAGSLVASVASASALQGAWIAALPSDPSARQELDRGGYARDEAQARRVGRLHGGWSIPDGARPLERTDGRIGLDLPPGQHLVAVGARGFSTQLHAVTVPASGRLDLAVDLGPRVEPAVLLLSLKDARGRPLRREELRLGLRPEGAQRLVVRKDVAPPPAAKDPLAQSFVDGLREVLDDLISMLVLDPLLTDGDGRVRLELAPGTWKVAGSARGTAQDVELVTPNEGVAVTLAPGQTQELALSTHPIADRGDLLLRVVDRDGRPVPHARFVLATASNGGLPHIYNQPIEDELEEGDPSMFERRAGPDGTRLLRDVPLGPAAVIAREGARGGRSAIVVLERPGVELPLEVVLDQELAVSALEVAAVDAATGAPITGELQLRLRWASGASRTQRAKRADRETIRLGDLPPGRVTLRAWGPDHVPCAPASVELGQGRVAKVELRLSRGAALSGRVVRPDGSGAAGRLVVRDPGEEHLERDVALAADGSFRAGGLPAGVPVDLLVRHVPGHLDQRFDGLLPADDLRLELDDGVAAEVVVTDPDGAPITSAEITLGGSDAGERGDHRRGEAFTDADGRAVVRGRLPDEHVYLRVEGPRSGRSLDRTHEGAYLELGAGAPPRHAVTLRLVPSAAEANCVISGRVVDAQGLPVAGVSVGVRYRLQGGGEGGAGADPSDADGRFTAKVPGPTRVTVGAQKGRLHGRAEARVAPDAPAEVELVVVPWALVSGRVRNPGSRRLEVLARLVGERQEERVTLEGGGAAETPFSFGYLAPGRWQLSVRDERWQELAALELDLRDGLDRTDALLDLPPP